mmetsp:Transcript_5630/g.12291  ORF Transcript_5630/g.12291 Transcript_5630/m.12291 type:complete len:222 (-) Transcript_5630:1039-1704(-)
MPSIPLPLPLLLRHNIHARQSAHGDKRDLPFLELLESILLQKIQHPLSDVFESFLAPRRIGRVQFVHGHDELRHAQSSREDDVFSRLAAHDASAAAGATSTGIGSVPPGKPRLELPSRRRDHQQPAIRAGRPRNHIGNKVPMSRRVQDGEIVPARFQNLPSHSLSSSSVNHANAKEDLPMEEEAFWYFWYWRGETWRRERRRRPVSVDLPASTCPRMTRER